MQYQTGSGVGTAVQAQSPDAPTSEGGVREHLNPRTEAGQAMIVAAVAFVLLILLQRSEDGIPARIGRALEFVAVVMSAVIVGNWALRTYTLRGPDRPASAGIRFNV